MVTGFTGSSYESMDDNYKKLLQKQYVAINKEKNNIEQTATKLRKILFSSNEYLTEHERKVKSRCCNMPLLEQKSNEYQKNVSQT